MDPLLDGGGWVVLTEQPNPMMAHWIAGGVEAEGIPVHVEENNLADEFAMVRKMAGLMPIRVLVPAERFEEANTVFLNLSQPIPLLDDADLESQEEDEELEAMNEAYKDKNRLSVLIIILLVFGAPFLVWRLAVWLIPDAFG